MGRKRDAVWAFFNDPVKSEAKKVKRAACRYCENVVTGTTTNLKAHVMRCPKVPSDHGIIPPPAVLKARRRSMSNVGGGSATVTPENHALLQSITTAVVTPTFKSSIDEAISSAIHQTCLPFNVFAHPAWSEFFAKLRPDYVLPSPHTIGSTLLDAEYATVMESCKTELAHASTAVLGVDGVSRTSANVVVHTPYPWFMHNLHSGIHAESCTTICGKIENAVTRVREFVGNGLEISGFVSDASRNMCKVRELLLANKTVIYAYGCSICPLNSFCRDILSLDIFRQLVKKAVFISKTVKLDSFVGSLFESLCFEKLLTTLRMVLYSRSKWSSCNIMFSRLLHTKSVLTLLPIRLLQDRDDRTVDSSYELPSDFFAAVTSSSFWRSMESAVKILNPICYCIQLLQHDHTPLSTSYAVFLYLTARLSDSDDGLGLPTPHRKQLLQQLLNRWNTIYSPVHALSFFCDPLYKTLRTNLTRQSDNLIELGQGDLTRQCETALKILANGNSPTEDLLLTDFKAFRNTPHTDQSILKSDIAPANTWTDALSTYQSLAPVLIKLYQAPATCAGSRANRDGRLAEMNRRLYAGARATIGADRVERQDAIAHNSQHCDRIRRNDSGGGTRVGGFEFVVAAYGTARYQTAFQLFLDNVDQSVMDFQGEDDEHMLRALDQARTIDGVSEDMLFSEEFCDL